MNGTDNWVDSELARDIAIWRASQQHPHSQKSARLRQQSFEEYALQTWFDDGGSSILEMDLPDDTSLSTP